MTITVTAEGKSFEVPLEGLSDRISKNSDGLFTNHRTHETGAKLKDVCEDGYHYIYLDYSMQGYYAWHDKCADVLIILLMHIHKNGKMEHHGSVVIYADRDKNAFRLAEGMYDSIYGTDICGQYLGGGFDDNISIGAKEVMLEFFGGPSFNPNNGYFCLFDREETINDVLNSLYNPTSDRIYGCERIGMEQEPDMTEWDDSETRKILFNMCEDFKMEGDYDCFCEDYPVCVLDWNGHCYVLRCFFVNLKLSASKDLPDELELYEFRQINASLLQDVECDMLKSQFIWYDKEHMQNNILQYHANDLDYLIDTWKSSPFHTNKIGFLNVCINANPIIHEMRSMGHEKINEELSNLYYDCDFGLSINIGIRKLYGAIYAEKRKIHQKLGIPKKTFEIVESKRMNHAHFIHFLKSAFVSCPDYLANMNEQSLRELAESNVFTSGRYVLYDAKNAIARLICMYGPENHLQYFNYIGDKEFFTKETKKWLDYIECLTRIGKYARFFKWNVDGKKLELSYRKAMKYYQMVDVTDDIFSKKVFEGRAKEYIKYDYSDDTYCISYPKTSDDLIIEGAMLNHCVGNYITEVMNGTTDILFIRRKNEPEKPFYTLEISGDAVRQCHGVNNCNITDKTLMDFLKAFCEEKGITFHLGTQLCGI